jgi:ribosomal-protein-alanine N-acetyltransferase
MPVRIDTMKEGDVAAVASIDGPTRMSDEQLRAEIQRPWARLWVARDANHGVVAFVIAWHVADEIHVLNVATRADRRRRGIARNLMNQVVQYARAGRAKHVLLEVRRSNVPAITLYRGLRFSAIGVRTRYYQDDEDAIEMALSFDVETGEIVPHADEVRLHS